eukprot:CAMPEP_0196660618 /NCGR_PEP_ID=MMETSP1086-20130531/40661_1 /TAXON_ID=77921 /ORGANISM="Cyanoptyche  gloeocystis , Strain SAG4.97" /LENGTH=69 /DNA_ID=CAMNT_0041995123 /DNA_START=307 /DNA_END=513 /DNA_ORIENTATION=+
MMGGMLSSAFASLDYVDVSASTFLVNVSTIWSPILGFLFFKEYPNRYFLFGAAVMMCGVILVVLGQAIL